MKLTEILPVEKWVELEKEINSMSGLNAAVFDTEGIRITDYKKWANNLCPAIKSSDKGQSFICSVAHMNMAKQAKQTRKPVVEECDAGLIKLVVPIFAGDEFLGAAGGCGLLPEGGEVDTFAVNKIAELGDDEVKRLSQGIHSITTDKILIITEYLQKKTDQIVKDFQETLQN